MTAFSLTGCFVQSFHPFCTDVSKFSPPQIVGEWELIRSGSDDLAGKGIKSWTFAEGKHGYDVSSYNKENVPGNLNAVFFKLGDMTFCDFSAGDLVDNPGINEFWIMNVRPVHTIARAVFKDDVLTLKPMDAEWMAKGLEKQEWKLPHLKPADPSRELVLFTATPDEWEKFLKQHGANAKAFPDKLAYVLRKKNPSKDQSK